MPGIYGQLERAQLENLSSDPAWSGIVGAAWWNTAEGRVKVADGSLIRALLRNDSKAVIGNSGTANDNIRLHRGAVGVLQFLAGADATSEGTLSTALNQLSFRAENYTFSGKPAVGNAGRIAYITDRSTVLVDTGSAWVPLGGGGGGGSLKWVEDAISPIPEIEYQQQVYKYAQGALQKLYALVKVPASYVAGSPIALKLPFYSPENANTALLQTVATLIKPGVDAITSTTNQRTSTNTAVTLSAGTVDIPQNVVLDLSSSTGTINSVAVAAGDLLKVELGRGTDTAVEDLRALVYATEISFS
jgi:hypothetical protein